jgi:hypothetical protein
MRLLIALRSYQTYKKRAVSNQLSNGERRVGLGGGGVQRSSLGCSVALRCSVDQVVFRWHAVRQVRVRISACHPREVPPTEPATMKIWRRASANE